jgi:hypothetical protein
MATPTKTAPDLDRLDTDVLRAEIAQRDQKDTNIRESMWVAGLAARIAAARSAYVETSAAADSDVHAAEAEFNRVANDPAATLSEIFTAFKAVRLADAHRHGVGMAVCGVLNQVDPLPPNVHSGAEQGRQPIQLQFKDRSFAQVLDAIIEGHVTGAVHAAMLGQQRAIGGVADAASADARAAAERSGDGRVDVKLPETMVQQYDRRVAELDHPSIHDRARVQRELLLAENGGKAPKVI